MIAQHYKDMLGSKSVIRQISEWSTARGAEIGYENVFDYSLGNPSVPCPPQFTAACADLLAHTERRGQDEDQQAEQFLEVSHERAPLVGAGCWLPGDGV